LNNAINRVFLLGSERSGTNLIRKILDNHSQIAAPPPLHALIHLHKYFKKFPAKENYYDKCFELTQIKDSILSWTIDIHQQEYFSRKNSNTIIEAVYSVYDQYAAQKGKTHWFSKEARPYDYLQDIRTQFPDTKFLYLIRDPRDVAASIKKMFTNDSHVYFISKMWFEEQEKIHQQLGLLGSNLLTIRYEDLISKSEATVSHICRFMEVEFEDEMLQSFHANNTTAEKEIPIFKHLNNGVLSSNSGKYLKTLRRSEIEIIESNTAKYLQKYNYDVHSKTLKEISFQKPFYKVLNSLGNKRKRRKMSENKYYSNRNLALKKFYNS